MMESLYFQEHQHDNTKLHVYNDSTLIELSYTTYSYSYN